MMESDERVAGQRSCRQLALERLIKKYCTGGARVQSGEAEAELHKQVHLAELRARLMEERLHVGATGCPWWGYVSSKRPEWSRGCH
jgi:hypothetical protein